METRCPECIGELRTTCKGTSQTTTCVSCGWSVTTSYFAPIQLDNEDYQIFVRQNNSPSIKQIKLVSQISGKNFVETKKEFQLERNRVFIGKATDVLPVKQKLDEEKILYEIVPEFIYG